MAATRITLAEAGRILESLGETPCSVDMRMALDQWAVSMLREHARPALGRACPTAWEIKTDAARELGYDSPNLVPFRQWGPFVSATTAHIRDLIVQARNHDAPPHETAHPETHAQRAGCR